MTSPPLPVGRVVRGVELVPGGVEILWTNPNAEPSAAVRETLPEIGESEIFEQGVAQGYEQCRREIEATSLREKESALEVAAEAARRQGYEAGLEDARNKTAVVLRNEVAARDAAWNERVQALDRVAAALSASFDSILQAAEDEIVCLCHEVMGHILGERLTSTEGIGALVERIRANRRGPPFSIALLNPVDYDLVVGTARMQATGLEWRADPSVECGGVILQHAHGSVDARFEVTMRAIQDLLRAERDARRAAAKDAR